MTDVKVGEKKLKKDGSSSKVLADFELWKNDEPYTNMQGCGYVDHHISIILWTMRDYSNAAYTRPPLFTFLSCRLRWKKDLPRKEEDNKKEIEFYLN